MSPSPFKVTPERSALLVIDVQERLFAAMDPARRDAAAKAIADLAFAARRLDVPIVVTEQYPQGLGPTVAHIREEVGAATVIAKAAFSCWAAEEARPHLERLAGRTVVVVGMETHVCVWQTVRDLRGAGYDVHVAHDGVLSRTDENRRAGLDLCRAAGAVVTGCETVAFDWLGRSGGDVFKEFSKRIR